MELREGYKKTEVGIIPNDWDLHNIIDNSTLKARIGWQGLTTAEYLDNGEYYLVTGTDFFDGKIKWETCHFVEEVRYSQDKNIQLKCNDILITKDGTIGKVAYIDSLTLPATLNSGVFVIRPKNKGYISLYVFYVFNSIFFAEFLRKLVAGSTITHLYQKDFVTFKFPLPRLPEQKAIAEVLSDTDNLIQALEKRIAKKRLIKQGAMQKLLTPKDDWEVKKLGEICDVRDGTHQTPNYVNSGIPFYSVENITRNDFINTKYITESEHKFLTKNWKIEKGDILMTRIGSIGDCKFIDWNVTASFYVSLALLKMKKGFSGQFLSHYSTSAFFKKEIELNSLAHAIPKKINLGQISNVKVIIPFDYKEQTRIATILSDMGNEIEKLESKLAKYKMLKQGLMQNLLTGKIRLI
ncbi:type I restriction enzyme, S subunit [Candidatus Magnetomoraceae bacterium gMMP-15]